MLTVLFWLISGDWGFGGVKIRKVAGRGGNDSNVCQLLLSGRRPGLIDPQVGECVNPSYSSMPGTYTKSLFSESNLGTTRRTYSVYPFLKTRLNLSTDGYIEVDHKLNPVMGGGGGETSKNHN